MIAVTKEARASQTVSTNVLLDVWDHLRGSSNTLLILTLSVFRANRADSFFTDSDCEEGIRESKASYSITAIRPMDFQAPVMTMYRPAWTKLTRTLCVRERTKLLLEEGTHAMIGGSTSIQNQPRQTARRTEQIPMATTTTSRPKSETLSASGTKTKQLENDRSQGLLH